MFWRDFLTPDGTCIRDYIHVDDLAGAHLLAFEYLARGGATDALDLGQRSGSSVQQVLEEVKQVIGLLVSVEDALRCAGDPAVLVANAGKAHDVWYRRSQHAALDKIVRDTWRWEQTRSALVD